jgi:hypothetical protein
MADMGKLAKSPTRARQPASGWEKRKQAPKRMVAIAATGAMVACIPSKPLEDAMAQPPPFEFPQQLRELTERNVEHARAAYGQFMDAFSQAIGTWASAAPANAMTSSFKVVQDRAVKFAKQNGEACFNLASDLANAKDVADVFGIQSRHAQQQMQAYALQAQELTRLMVEAAQSMGPKSS